MAAAYSAAMADLLTGLTDDDITTTRGVQSTRMQGDADTTDAPASDGTDTGDVTDTSDQGDAPATDSDGTDADSDGTDGADVDGTDG